MLKQFLIGNVAIDLPLQGDDILSGRGRMPVQVVGRIVLAKDDAGRR